MGAAYAAGTRATSSKTITACALKTTGAMRLLSKGKCAKTERTVKWNSTGPAGKAGPVGAPGANGTNGTNGAAGAAGTDGVSATCAGGGVCKIGDTGPGGGIVFYVDTGDSQPGFNYLEAAPADVSGGMAWCSDTNASVGVAGHSFGSAVGTGVENTWITLNSGACAGSAALTATQYRGPTNKNDWFLPSINELGLMWSNLYASGLGGFTDWGFYWSSTYVTTGVAKAGAFQPGGMWALGDGMQQSYQVRPIRAF